MRSIFHTAKDAFDSAEGDNPSTWIVFRVTEVTDAEAGRQLADDAKRISQMMQRQLGDDIFGQYVGMARG